MATLLDKIFGGKKAPTAEEIRAEQSRAETTLGPARAELESARERYNESLLSSDLSDTRTARAALINAEDGVARAEALVSVLRNRFLQACEAEAAEARRHRYDEAVKAQRAAAKRLEREYGPAAMALVSIIAEIARADHLVNEANENLPEGAPQLYPTEHAVRGWPGEHRQTLSQEVIERWMFEGAMFISFAPNWLTPEQETRIDRTGPRSGIYRGEKGRSYRVELHRFRQTEYLEGRGSSYAVPLSASVSLPGLYVGADEIWAPRGTDTEGVLKRAHLAEQHAKARRPTDPRFPRDTGINFELLPPDDPPSMDEAAE